MCGSGVRRRDLPEVEPCLGTAAQQHAARVRTGYARERSCSFFPPSHSRRARVLEWVFRVQRCVLHEMVELEACSRYQGNLNTDCHGLLLGFLPNSFLPSTLSCTENPSRGNVSSWYCRSIDLQ